jgi:hypothetical protein
VRERGECNLCKIASGFPPLFVSKWIRQEEYERGRENSRLGCLLGQVGEEKRKEEKKRIRFGEFGQNSFEF